MIGRLVTRGVLGRNTAGAVTSGGVLDVLAVGLAELLGVVDLSVNRLVCDLSRERTATDMALLRQMCDLSVERGFSAGVARTIADTTTDRSATE